jgi:hypothetical protein
MRVPVAVKMSQATLDEIIAHASKVYPIADLEKGIPSTLFGLEIVIDESIPFGQTETVYHESEDLEDVIEMLGRIVKEKS